MKTATCIVGYNDRINKKLILAGDSAGVAGLHIRIRKDEKVFKKRNMIFGFTSSFRMGQILRYHLKIPTQKSRMDDFTYIINIVESIRKSFKKYGYSKISNNEESGGCFILGYKDCFYIIEEDYQVGVWDSDYCACGCGETYALGTLFALRDTSLDVEQKVIKALDCATNYSGGVRPPYNIVELPYGDKK